MPVDWLLFFNEHLLEAVFFFVGEGLENYVLNICREDTHVHAAYTHKSRPCSLQTYYTVRETHQMTREQVTKPLTKQELGKVVQAGKQFSVITTREW